MTSAMATPITRRRWLDAALALAAVAPLGAQARSVADWMPYPAGQVMRIEPTLTRAAQASATIRIEPQITDFEPVTAAGQGSASSYSGQDAPPLGDTAPRAYVRTARKFRLDPWLLYGVALQESRLAFGERALPYPWTLCVRGEGLRYGNYRQTLAALKGFVGRDVTNVDCGAMQVNWHWHHERLGSFERALDPYPNLEAGAAILRGHYDRHGNWRKAVALYHTGSEDTAAKRSRGARYAEQTLSRLTRLGIRTEAHRG